MGVAELAVPAWAERGRRTRRGTPSTSPSATACSRSSCWARRSCRRRWRSRRWSTTARGDVTVGPHRGRRAAHRVLDVVALLRQAGAPTRWCRTASRSSWGYGHYVVFAAAAAVGAGRGGGGRLASTGHAHTSDAHGGGGVHRSRSSSTCSRSLFIQTLPARTCNPAACSRSSLVAIVLVGRGDVHRPAGAAHRGRARGAGRGPGGDERADARARRSDSAGVHRRHARCDHRHPDPPRHAPDRLPRPSIAPPPRPPRRWSRASCAAWACR